MVDNTSNFILERIANALERLAPPDKKITNLDQSEGFVFESKSGLIRPVENINRISISLLKGINNQKEVINDLCDKAELYFNDNVKITDKKWTSLKKLIKKANIKKRDCILLPFKTLKKIVSS